MKRMFLGAFAFALMTASAGAAEQVDLLGVRLIVVGSEAEAGALAARVAAGEEFEELARKHSIDPSAAAGGYLGAITFGELRREFQDALRDLGPGETSTIARIDERYGLLQLLTADQTLLAAAQAGHAEIVRRLVRAGADLGVRSDRGATPLMEAAHAGHIDVARILLAGGADVNASFPDDSTILMAAALAGHAGVVQALLEGGAKVNASAKNGSTALIEAAYAGHVDSVRMLLAAEADINARLQDGSTALMAAALAGHTDVVRMLVQAGAEVRARAKNASTALMEAAYPGHIDIVRILLGAGADVNARLDDGWTPLMAAALGGHIDLVHALIDAGADVNARNRLGWTALMHAAASVNMPMVKTLLASGADVSAEERRILVGSTYVNEYYSSNEAGLLDLASSEFQRVLDVEPRNLAALAWMGAVEVLRWDDDLDLQQFRRANLLLKKCVDLDPDQSERHYWIAATSWMFAIRGKGASAGASAAIIDEGIEHANKAVAVDPQYFDAMVYLSLLYREKAKLAATSADRDRLLRIGDAVYQDSLKVREEVGARPPLPDDVLRPAPPPPPAPPFDDAFPYGRPKERRKPDGRASDQRP